MFSPQTYTARRDQLKSKFNSGILLFPGNDESSMNYHDNTYHFRQDSTFLYYFGLDHQAGLVGLIDIDENKDWIYGNDYTIDDVVWMGSMPTIRERSEASEIKYTGNLDELARFLTDAIKKGRKIHFLPAYRPEHHIKLFNWLDIAFFISGIVPGVFTFRIAVACQVVPVPSDLYMQLGLAFGTEQGGWKADASHAEHTIGCAFQFVLEGFVEQGEQVEGTDFCGFDTIQIIFHLCRKGDIKEIWEIRD